MTSAANIPGRIESKLISCSPSVLTIPIDVELITTSASSGISYVLFHSTNSALALVLSFNKAVSSSPRARERFTT